MQLQVIMSDQYSRGILKMVIAQICQMIGWHSINSNPLEFLVDLMQEYLLRLSKLTHQYSEILGRTEANLDDLGLTFQHMHVLIPELLEYVRNVDSVPCIIPIPRFPVCRDDHLNFLKPGSHEVVTRLVHVHEHLPAMYPNAEHVISSEKDETATNRPPDLSDESPSMSITSGSTVQDQTSPPSVFKRPSGLSGSENPILAKRSKIIEEGRPLREIHSVIMTTSGFLSPAREGKLPEPRTPQSTRPDSPPVSSYPMVPPELKIEKKPKKIVKKNLAERKLDKENKKKNQVKELFIPDNMNEMKAKKLARLKDAANKSKSSKSSGSKGHSGNPGSSNKTDNVAINVEKEVSTKTTKSNQTKVKTEKITNETTTPVTISQPKEETVGKLLSEPDKQKLNIFKKISKPREEKIVETQEISRHKDVETRDSLAGPANVLPDDNDRQNDAHVKREEKKTPRTPDVHVNETRESTDIHSPPTNQGYIFDDMSPPGTPSTPKTPEFSVTVPEFKKKKNERNSRKKEQRTKSPSRVVSPKKTKTVVNVPDVEEPQSSERLKTPVQPMEPQFDKKTPNSTTPLAFPFFAPFPSAPGLIPHPIGHPMFPRYPIPMGRNPSGPHPGIPNLPIPPRFMIPNPKSDDFSPPKIQQTSDFTKKSKPVVEEIPEPEIVITNKFEKPVVIKTAKNVVTESEIIHKTHAAVVEKEIQPIVPILPAGTSINVSSVTAVTQSVGKDEKVDKVEKSTKKSKDHKKEKKEKLKKKKEKKEKYKVKDKIKGKKGKIPKLKEKKDKKDKRKEKDKDDNTTEAVPKITLKLNPASPRPPTPDNTPMKKITIKPLAKKVDEDKKRDPSPELAKISALVTRPPKQKVTKAKADAVAHSSDGIDDRKIGDDVPSTEPNNSDQVSRQVWICPACGNQDDGSPMIGCDDCDAWYHWVCVGVQVPPADHEDWYCRLCIAKKQELHDKKKKKRKKRVKQGHGVHQGS